MDCIVHGVAKSWTGLSDKRSVSVFDMDVIILLIVLDYYEIKMK